MGRKSYRKTKTKITTKNAISKSELRAARRREESQINEAISSKREIRNQQNKKEEVDMLAATKINDIGAVGIPASKETIISEFKNEKMSIPVIADTHGMNDDEILSTLVCYFYLDGLSMLKCSDKFGITYRQVQKILRQNNVEIRPRGFQKHTKDEDVQTEENNKTLVEKKENSINSSAQYRNEPISFKANCKNEDSSSNNKDELKPSSNTIIFCEQSLFA